MIVRAAAVKYKEQTGPSIEEKLERMLDLLFRVIGRKRLKDEVELDVSSESDYTDEDL